MCGIKILKFVTIIELIAPTSEGRERYYNKIFQYQRNAFLLGFFSGISIRS